MVELMHQTLDENRLVQNKWFLATMTKVVMGFWKEWRYVMKNLWFGIKESKDVTKMKSRFSFSQTFDHHRETPSTMSCTYSIAEPVINENWSLLTPLQQQYHWCRQHFSCKMTIQSMFFSINDKQPFRPTLVALKLMGKMTSKCLPFFQYFMPFHYCKTIKDSIQLNFCNLTKEEN